MKPGRPRARRLRPQAPDPDMFRAELARALEGLLPMASLLEREYRWVYGAALDREVHGTQGGTSDIAYADPTGEIAGAKEHLRVELDRIHRDALKNIGDCHDRLLAARKAIRKALARLNPPPVFEPTRYPRTATLDDLAQARAAQERRAEAGGGFGET